MLRYAVMSATFRVVFMGSPDYALPALEALHTQFPGCVVGVFSRPDQPKGRGQHLEATPIKIWALAHQIPVFTPTTKTDLHETLASLKPDLVIVIAYGMILPPQTVSQFYCVNAHGSILPQYRGASPVQAALLAGDTQTGVTLIRMNDKMDEGDILQLNRIEIGEDDHFAALFTRLSELSARAICAFIQSQWLPKTLSSQPQPLDGVSYCHKIKKADAELLPTESPLTHFRKIRAFSPAPGAFIQTEQGPVKILEASYSEAEGLHPITVQPPGKKSMPYRDYCLGHPKGLFHAS